jgi:SAM-dependent methyltransferase
MRDRDDHAAARKHVRRVARVARRGVQAEGILDAHLGCPELGQSAEDAAGLGHARILATQHGPGRETLRVEPKPKGWDERYAAWFEEPSAASRYDLRPAYPAETFPRLASLATDEPRAVLDAGCGLGELARGLAPLVGRVDAVDRSTAMLSKGRMLPGAEAANLRWVHARIEDAPLDPPYALIVAGDSVHWFDWPRTIPRFARVLSVRGLLALVYREWLRASEVRARLAEVYARHGANPDFAPLDPVHELEQRGLFERLGDHTTASEPWTPTLEELIGCHHSQNGFVLEKMRDPAAFDREVTTVVEELAPKRGDRFQLDVVARISWGRPVDPGPPP